MKFVADFHIHSKYSRATSKDMNIPTLAKYAKKKGIQLLGTGDFTHPMWVNELKSSLVSAGRGIYKYEDTYFILTGEVSTIFRWNGQTKRVHSIIFAPTIEIVEKLNKILSRYGNLMADGRPVFTISSQDLVKLIMDVSSDCFVVPAHIWTPWFSVFGSNSGFDSLEDCFGPQLKYIFALETGLSSDPAMNWRLSKLDNYSLISNSDSHSPARIGREANVLNTNMDYYDIKKTLESRNKNNFLYTLEFFPEEGKYHFDGHRECHVSYSPVETKRLGGICPKCGKKLTIGVMNRIESLADRPDSYTSDDKIPFKKLIPMDEIIASCLKKDTKTQAVEIEYNQILSKGASEIDIMLNMPYEQISKITTQKIAQAILNVREEKVNIAPGYDGVYGKIDILDKDDTNNNSQLTLF